MPSRGGLPPNENRNYRLGYDGWADCEADKENPLCPPSLLSTGLPRLSLVIMSAVVGNTILCPAWYSCQ